MINDIWMTNFFQSFMILLVFGILILFNVFYEKIASMKDKWSDNRCNPFFMPFSLVIGNIDPLDNFEYCILQKKIKISKTT